MDIIIQNYHLTIPQQNIWNLQKFYQDTAVSNLCGAIFYNEKRDSEKLCQVITCFVKNQSGIRLRFEEKEEVIQYVSEEVDAEIPVREFASREALEEYAEQFAQKPIGLTGGKLYRFEVFQLENQSGILVVLSHLIADAWTFGLMAKQVDELFHTLQCGNAVSVQQADYTEFIRAEKEYLASEKYQKDKEYWENKYAVRPETSMVKLCPGIPGKITSRRICRTLSYALEETIQLFCSQNSITPAVLFETALIVYLSKINAENQTITIGIPVLNRSNVREKSIAGMFISTMPLTVTVEPGMAVLELAKRITRIHREIFRHQKYPYSNILTSLREKQNFSGNLYEVMVSYQNARTDTDAETKWYSNGACEIPLEVHIDNRDGGDSHTINIDYQTAVFTEQEVNYLLDRLEYILEQMAEESTRLLRDISIVPEKELKKILEEFNDTRVEYPQDKCIHELFMEQVERTPEKTALVDADGIISYKELDFLSNCFAYGLTEKGVGIGDVVAFALSRKIHMIAVILGILKCGAAYMPIDRRYPKNRINYMLAESNAKIFITEKNYKEYLQYTDARRFSIEINSTNPCYCIYTSGSTGVPKGIVMCHRGIVNLLKYKKLYSVMDKCKNIALLTTITFDVATQEIFTALLNGYTGYLFNEKSDMSISEVITMLQKYQIDMFFCSPSYLNILCEKYSDADKVLNIVKCINLAGERFYVNENIKECSRQYDVAFENQYGPAETHVITATRIKNFTNITIGKPIANTQIYILDWNGAPLPIGVAGELCIAGDGVGLGYLNRPELTAERFVENPFATAENYHGKVMYHTGDLARWREDGEIEYLGRMDTQVKIRGLRIELGEIESVMAGFPGIQLAAVADKKEENGRQYLVGYYTAEQELDVHQLREHLANKLPNYMVPNYFVHLETMPMTASGKTDRRNLPIPDTNMQKETYVEPETETEKKLAGIWMELLKVEKVSRRDDFFELGGDSLLAIALLNEIAEAFFVEPFIKDVMERSSLEQLALCIEQYIKQVTGKEERINPCGKNRYVLLPQQKAIYAACQKERDSLQYNMPARLLLSDKVDREKLKHSICRVVKHHKILSSCIAAEGEALYGVYDKTAEPVFENYTKGTEDSFVRAFDLQKAPLLHVGFTEDALLFDIHHIIADGGTLNIMLRDIIRVYEGRELLENEVWYGDYAEYFAGCDFAGGKAYFQEKLACELEKLELPLTRCGRKGGASRFYQIPEQIVSGAGRYGAKHQLTDTMVFLGAYGILLSRYSAKKNILSSIILKNRIHRETRDMAGMFVNTLPVNLEVEGSIQEYFQKVKELLLNQYQYQELPFLEIADAVGMNDKTVVNTSFVYQADGELKLVLDGQMLQPEIIETGTSKFDLSMELTPVGQGMKLRLEYNCEKYDDRLMDRLAESYMRILTQLEKNFLSEVTVLSAGEYKQIVEEFNDTRVEYPQDKCIHELFMEQVERTPEKTALVFEEKEFTYRELDEMSNSLAHFLREKGVTVGDRVAVLMQRDERVIMAQLAAVADKKEENGRQYLVGYYTAEQELDVHQLREHLANKLPNYMVPNYFVNLETMPMTASGKTDRRNLPIPDTTVQKETYVEPETGREKLLCRLMEEVLGVEKVGMTDDFFERGGDSLSAMEYIAKAHDAGMILPLQVIFDCPTVRALCGYLESGRGEKAHYEASMFEKYQKVLSANVVDETFIPVKKALGNVLLTGATGFLGAHILDYLMREESGKIYCLIRSERKDDRRGRLLETLNYYFGGKYEQEIGRRIIPVIGDIEKETLADEMPADVQTVIHTAASVKHYGSHEYFHRVNCEGTKHVVNYAGKIGAKLIHISTISVSGNTMADDFTVYRSEEEKHFSEQSLYIGQPLENVYVQSKFEAERVVYDAILSGLDAKVIRVGNLTNRLGDFKFQPNYEKNAFLTRVKALLEFGQFPEYLMTLYAEFSPVDLTAEGIVRIAQYAGNQTVFHLNSNRPVYFERFQEVIHQLGISMKVVNGGDFYKALQQTIKKAGTEYIFEAFQNDMDEQGNLVYDSNIHIENEFTVWFLQRVGFEWNETDVDYIKGYIAYFRELGYLRV